MQIKTNWHCDTFAFYICKIQSLSILWIIKSLYDIDEIESNFYMLILRKDKVKEMI